jgi:sugar phosphate isomerase/epimerase
LAISIANAPCSWGVEFPQDRRNPAWTRVLDECRDAGYQGIELGPIGYLPEDPARLAEALASRSLALVIPPAIGLAVATSVAAKDPALGIPSGRTPTTL